MQSRLCQKDEKVNEEDENQPQEEKSMQGMLVELKVMSENRPWQVGLRLSYTPFGKAKC